MKKTSLVSLVLVLVSFLSLGLLRSDQIRAKQNQYNDSGMTSGMKYDDKGHVLSALWEKYQEADRQDLPDTQLDILEEILKKAGEQKLAWDFYDAASRYQTLTVQKNWKQRDHARQLFSKQVKEFDVPVVTLLYQFDYGQWSKAVKILEEEADRLSKSHHPNLYEQSGRLGNDLNGQLAKYISNDYEYALWLMIQRQFKKWSPVLEKYLDGRYPNAGWLEWKSIEDQYRPYSSRQAVRAERRKAIELFGQRYEGRALSFYAREELIFMDWEEEQKKKVENEEAFQEINEACKTLLSERKKLKASEKRLYGESPRIKNLLEQLKSPSLRLEVVERDSVKILFRNLNTASFCILENAEEENTSKEVLMKRKVKTSDQPFYIEEKVVLALPELNDGAYIFRVENGKTENETAVHFHTLSLAQRTNSQGAGVYVTDWKTGEPLEKADFQLYENGHKIKELRDFTLEKGFTPLPSEWSQKLIDSKRYEMTASCRTKEGQIRRSRELYLYGRRRPYEDKTEKETHCQVYLDQSAYHPGQKVQFKAVLYEGVPTIGYHTLPAQIPVSVEFSDAENLLLTTLELKTDDFGSVAGSYELPTGLKNGQFQLKVRQGGETLRYHRFRVDEFVLPEFKVEFSPQEEVFGPGEEVKIKGKIQSYSGHPVTGTQADYEVSSYGQQITGGTLDLDESGEFRIRFQSLQKKEEWGRFYEIRLYVTGETGETHEYSTFVYVSARIRLKTEILNETAADLRLKDNEAHLVRTDHLLIQTEVEDQENNSLELEYQLLNQDKEVLAEGSYVSGEEVRMVLPEEDGLYLLEIHSHTGRQNLQEGHQELNILKMSPGAQKIAVPVTYLFSPYNTDLQKGEVFGALSGSNEKDTWMIAELYGDGKRLLESRFIHLDEEQPIVDLSFRYKEEYPEMVTLQLFYFKNKEKHYFEETFQRPRKNLELPLAWKSFQDKTTPDTHYSFTLQTLPEVQCLAAIYDQSLDEIRPNLWEEIRLRNRYLETVDIQSICGSTSSYSSYLQERNGWGNQRLYKCTTRSPFIQNELISEDEAMAVAPEAAGSDAGDEVDIRKDFATSLTFQPDLESDENGLIHLDFETKDKLSTFVVSLFAHNREMKNKVLRKEMLVTVPLKIAVTEPAFLYEGDEWRMKVAVASNLDRNLSGTLKVEQYEGNDFKKKRPFKKSSVRIQIPANGSQTEIFDIHADRSALALKLTFVSDDKQVSDGVFFSIPIREARQTITESHSALIRAGQNKKEIYRELKSRFVNGSGSGAEMREISILDRIREAIPENAQPEGADVIAYADALYIQVMAQVLGVTPPAGEKGLTAQQLLDKILDCRNQDGGFGWLEGMRSSPILTATLLERFAQLDELAAEGPWAHLSAKLDVSGSVRYLDENQLNQRLPYWCGSISIGQYLYVRSLYPAVRFEPQAGGSPKMAAERMKDFRKEVKTYLVPEGNRGLTGALFEKARRCQTLYHLTVSEEGRRLAEDWSLASSKELEHAYSADIASLVQYAVEHPDGGWYYPNLVMPFRGLLETEAYAHAMICDLLDEAGEKEKADGIRLWLMVQKETQHWEEEPGFIDAIHAVLQGSDELKQTSVLVLTQRYEKPFEEIKASGNGLSLRRQFFKKVVNEAGRTEFIEMRIGEELHVGDKILVRYQVHNDENRSFGRLTAWHEANLTPVNPLSGLYRWGIRPLITGSVFSYAPMSYRDVHADRSVFYLDVMPEENWSLEEEFFVTRAGVFQAPAVEIESLYAPHYRANDEFRSDFLKFSL